MFPWAWKKTARIRERVSSLLVDESLAGGARLFLQESFAPIYPDCGDRWITEDLPPQPAAYNRSVLDAEAAADRVTRAGGRGIVLRFAYFYGAGDRFTREMLTYARRGWLPIVGRPDGYFPTVNHHDAALAVLAALSAAPGIYNVVDTDPMTRREIGALMSDVLHVPALRQPPAWLQTAMGSVGETMARSLRISNAKLRVIAGWTPRFPAARDAWLAAVDSFDVPADR
jgi:nucleoside-diphosphate-sugar epimerase